MIRKSDGRAQLCRERAAATLKLAEACVLGQQREQHLAASAVWSRLADEEDQTTRSHESRKAALRRSAPLAVAT